jgi:hypothetical protein
VGVSTASSQPAASPRARTAIAIARMGRSGSLCEGSALGACRQATPDPKASNVFPETKCTSLRSVPEWSFLTNHARVLLCIAHDPARDCATSRPAWTSPSAPPTASSPTWPRRRRQYQGEERARLDLALPQLAAGLRSRLRAGPPGSQLAPLTPRPVRPACSAGACWPTAAAAAAGRDRVGYVRRCQAWRRLRPRSTGPCAPSPRDASADRPVRRASSRQPHA